MKMPSEPTGGFPPKQGLYDPQYEHDACGVGFVVNVKGRQSNEIVRQALTVLLHLDHRGACGSEVNTGDGAGILIQMPHRFLAEVCGQAGFRLPPPGHYGSGIVFLPHDRTIRRRFEKMFEAIAAEEGQEVLGWRTVPTDHSSLGSTARASEPYMRQVFVKRSPAIKDDLEFERKLYVVRKRAFSGIRQSGLKDCHYWHVVTLSYKTLVFKGMLLTEQLSKYFVDLNDPRLESALALVHSRFSTNTFPSWERAHPYRYMAHNGEINTCVATSTGCTPGRRCLSFRVVRRRHQEDPAHHRSQRQRLGDVRQLPGVAVLSGRSLPHAMMMMIPEPWNNHESMSDERKAFYEYHSCLMEPWDGPASIAFTDGIQIGRRVWTGTDCGHRATT
jgi:glutamate synthase domain-containing protein 1